MAVFDYYIATSGSDANLGTLASPWAITGINTKQSTYTAKRLGVLPGTYDVSVLMQNAGYQGAVLQIQGGTVGNPTYIGTSDASGNYLQGTATLDAFGSVGAYGGGNTAHSPYVLGQTIGSTGTGPQPTVWGNWIIDGLIFTRFSNWAVTLSGGIDTVPVQPVNCTIKNCTFENSVCTLTSTHPGPLMLYDYSTCLVSNCYFFNNTNALADQTHYASITAMGFGGGSSGLIVEYCTFVQSPGIYVIEDNGLVVNTTVRNCFFDFTTTTGVLDVYALAGGTYPTAGQPGSSFHHNIVKGGGIYDNIGFQSNYSAQACTLYNNSWDRVSGTAGDGLGFRFAEAVGFTALITAYNNLMYDNGAGGTLSNYGYMAANTDGFALCDYNIYGTKDKFTTYGANGGTANTAQTFATWKTATGKDAHSSVNSINPFTNNGAAALAYQISSGSPAYQTGHVGGLIGGAAVNLGAWDGIVTQIGFTAALLSSSGIGAIVELTDSLTTAGTVAVSASAAILENIDASSGVGTAALSGMGAAAILEALDLTAASGIISVSGIGTMLEGTDPIGASGTGIGIAGSLGVATLLEGFDRLDGFIKHRQYGKSMQTQEFWRADTTLITADSLYFTADGANISNGGAVEIPLDIPNVNPGPSYTVSAIIRF